MTQLFRVTAKNALEVSESPFLNETVDLEDFVIGNPVLLGEGTTIVARQIEAGAAGRLEEDLDHFDEYFNAAYGSASGTT